MYQVKNMNYIITKFHSKKTMEIQIKMFLIKQNNKACI